MKIVILFSLLTVVGCTNQKPLTTVTATSAPAVIEPKTLTTVAQTVPSQTEIHKKSCAKGEDKREFEIVKKDKGCMLNYTQAGKTKGATTAAVGLQQCERSEAKIVAKLEKSGFKCN